jgi:hypothetical protein
MEQQQFGSWGSFVYRFGIIYSKKTAIILFKSIKILVLHTDSIFGGTPTVNFSTKFGVGPRPMITYGNSSVN